MQKREEEEEVSTLLQTKLTSSTPKEVLKRGECERRGHISFLLQFQSLVRTEGSGTDEVWVWFGIWILNSIGVVFSKTKGHRKIKDFTQSIKGKEKSPTENRLYKIRNLNQVHKHLHDFLNWSDSSHPHSLHYGLIPHHFSGGFLPKPPHRLIFIHCCPDPIPFPARVSLIFEKPSDHVNILLKILYCIPIALDKDKSQQ